MLQQGHSHCTQVGVTTDFFERNTLFLHDQTETGLFTVSIKFTDLAKYHYTNYGNFLSGIFVNA